MVDVVVVDVTMTLLLFLIRCIDGVGEAVSQGQRDIVTAQSQLHRKATHHVHLISSSLATKCRNSHTQTQVGCFLLVTTFPFSPFFVLFSLCVIMYLIKEEQ